MHVFAQEAALLRLELIAGLSGPDDAIAWANGKIEELPDFDENLFELSLCLSDRPSAISYLGRIAEGAGQFDALRTLCAKIHLMLLKDRACVHWAMDALKDLRSSLSEAQDFPGDLAAVLCMGDSCDADAYLAATKGYLPLLPEGWQCPQRVIETKASYRPRPSFATFLSKLFRRK